MSLIHRQAMHKKAGFPSTIVVYNTSTSTITATLGFRPTTVTFGNRESGGHNIYYIGSGIYTSNTLATSIPAYCWLNGVGSGANNYQANARFISKTTAGTVSGSAANTWIDIGASPSWSLTLSAAGIASLRLWFQIREKIDGGTTLTKLISNVYGELYCDVNSTATPCPFCCFTPDTLITMADMSTKKIADISVGEYILTYDPDTEMNIPCEVTEVIIREFRKMYKIELSDGRILNSSDDHPIFTRDKGFASINPTIAYKDMGIPEKLSVGDYIMDEKGNYIEIVSMEEIYYPYQVYTFGNPRFYANGILVY